MTDLEALADSLRSQLEPAERARLAQKLVSTREPEAQSPYDAVRTLYFATNGLRYSLYQLGAEHPHFSPRDDAVDPAVHADLAATLHLTFDGFAGTLEILARHASGDSSHGDAYRWTRAMHSALNLRDQVGYLVPDDFDWSAHESSSPYGDGDSDA